MKNRTKELVSLRATADRVHSLTSQVQSLRETSKKVEDLQSKLRSKDRVIANLTNQSIKLSGQLNQSSQTIQELRGTIRRKDE